MKWIEASDLERWAKDRLDSRTLLAALVADLIRASVPHRAFFRFPNGNKGQIRGFDGDLEVDAPVEIVPGGKSKWEFGVSDGIRKAELDYKRKTASTPKTMRDENTLVLVTPHTLDTPKETLAAWLADKKGAGEWLDVRLVDGVQLEHWLDDHPAVSARYAREVLQILPKRGARSTDEFWNDIRYRYKPTLTEVVVLSGREGGAKQIISFLTSAKGAYVIGSESEDDVALFAVCAIRTASTDERLFLEARTLVVETAEAAAELAHAKGLVFIAIGAAVERVGNLATNGPAVVAATGVQRAKQQNQLVRPSASEMAEQMMSMGYVRDEAYSTAALCGRSLTVLQRLIPNGVARDAAWAGEAQNLKFALMLGGWSTKSVLDVSVIRELSDTTDYDAFELVLRKAQHISDPPVDNVEDVWKVRSPVDAFPYYGHLITDGDFARLREAAVKVFTHQAIRPSPHEKFRLDYVTPADYSNWIRRGLATTLVLIGSLPALGNLKKPHSQWQQYVDSVVEAIPGFSRGNLLELANRDEFGLLAEAAPLIFIRALEQAVAGPESKIRLYFTESDEMFAEASPHLGLLFAIERIAWSNAYLPRLVLVLAKLAEVDPGGRYSNRPIETLRVLLLPWAPQTFAPLAERIACLDAVLEKFPEVGWDLLVKLLPSNKTMSATPAPTIRDFSPPNPETLTYAVVWEANSAIATRVADAADGNLDRLTMVVAHLTYAAPQDRAKFLRVIKSHLAALDNTNSDPVWHALREEAQRHSYFSSTGWAMKNDELSAVQSLVEEYLPTDRIAVIKYLFDDWSPHIGTYGLDGDEVFVEQARVKAIREIWNEGDVEAVLQLSRASKLPHLVVESLVEMGLEQSDLLALLAASFGGASSNSQFSESLATAGNTKFGISWQKAVLGQVQSLNLSPAVIAGLVSGWVPSQPLWNAISAMGEAVEKAYWQSISQLPTGESRILAIRQLIANGRGGYAMRLAASDLVGIPSETILEMLSATLQDSDSHGNILGYLASRLFKELRTRADLGVEEIARMEFAYLQVLDADSEELLLHQMLRTNPGMFVKILSEVFRAENQEPRELSDVERRRATNCFHLLSSMRHVPGESAAVVDAEVLLSWINEARLLAKDMGRLRIADIQIGQLLAQSPPSESGVWPQSSVAQVVEEIGSEDIGRGIHTGRINLRGAYSKGIHEGGVQERELAARYNKWADSTARFPRIALVLREIAESWTSDAIREDASAEKSKLLD